MLQEHVKESRHELQESVQAPAEGAARRELHNRAPLARPRMARLSAFRQLLVGPRRMERHVKGKRPTDHTFLAFCRAGCGGMRRQAHAGQQETVEGVANPKDMILKVNLRSIDSEA